MFFYGWGTKVKEFPTPDGRVAVCVYKYASFMFIFKLVWSQKWHLVDANGASVEASKDDVALLFSPEKPPRLGLWTRFSLPITAVAFVALAVWATNGTTTVEDLAVSDCFVAPASDDEFRSLETPPCEEAHDSQLTAIIELEDGPESLPADTDPYWETVSERCDTSSIDQLTRFDSMPDETFMTFFGPTADGWDSGDREVYCYVYSPDGLDGSFVQSS